jgi:hypothetical protein
VPIATLARSPSGEATHRADGGHHQPERRLRLPTCAGRLLGDDGFHHVFPRDHLRRGFKSAVRTRIRAVRPTPSATPAHQQYQPGVGGYTLNSRWGDYPVIAVDPGNAAAVWVLGGYAKSTGAWGTEWALCSDGVRLTRRLAWAILASLGSARSRVVRPGPGAATRALAAGAGRRLGRGV